jgi:hypothetical protein
MKVRAKEAYRTDFSLVFQSFFNIFEVVQGFGNTEID